MTATATIPELLAPMQGESQVDYIDRVWDHVPGQDDVDKARFCRSAWLASGNDADLQRIAARRFPQDQFRTISGSAVFKEHTTKRMVPDPQTGLGREEAVIYDRNAIEAICDRNNRRIRESGDFSPLCDGHTPDKEQLSRGMKTPDVLGYAGPFYLGKVGERFAIFCDEHHHRGELARIDKLQRRSPEVWLEERMADRIFDPIACLGAQTPKLDLGITRYGREGEIFETAGRDGATLMRYAAPAAVAPAGGNAFIPEHTETKVQYEAGDGEMAMDTNDIQQLLQAIMDSQMGQVIQQLAPIASQLVEMVQGGAAAGEPAPPADPAPAAPEAPGPGESLSGDVDSPVPAPTGGAAPSPAGPPTSPPPGYEPDDEDKSQLSRYMSGESDDASFMQYMCGKKQKYMGPLAAATVGGLAGGLVGRNSKDGDAETSAADKYARDQISVQKADYQRQLSAKDQEIQRRDQRIRELESSQRKADRYARLNAKLAEGFQIDVNEEYESTADYTDDQFERHLTKVVARYERIPLADHVPVMETSVEKVRPKKTDDYARQRAEAIQKLVTDARGAGQSLTWDQAAAKYDEQHPVAS